MDSGLANTEMSLRQIEGSVNYSPPYFVIGHGFVVKSRFSFNLRNAKEIIVLIGIVPVSGYDVTGT